MARQWTNQWLNFDNVRGAGVLRERLAHFPASPCSQPTHTTHPPTHLPTCVLQVGSALLTLFITATLDGYTPTMYASMASRHACDGRGRGRGRVGREGAWRTCRCKWRRLAVPGPMSSPPPAAPGAAGQCPTSSRWRAPTLPPSSSGLPSSRSAPSSVRARWAPGAVHFAERLGCALQARQWRSCKASGSAPCCRRHSLPTYPPTCSPINSPPSAQPICGSGVLPVPAPQDAQRDGVCGAHRIANGTWGLGCGWAARGRGEGACWAPGRCKARPLPAAS